MLSRLLEIIDKARYPAFGVWQGQCYANQLARRLAATVLPADAFEAVRLAAEASLASRRVSSLRVGDLELLALPILSLGGSGDIVLVGQFDVADLPQLYVDLAGGTSPWSDLVTILPGLVFTARPDARIDFWNRQWKRYTGNRHFPSTAGIIGSVAAEDTPAFEVGWRHGIASRTTFSLQVRLKRHDGSLRWHHFVAEPLLRKGNLIKWIVVATDVDDAVEARAVAELATRRVQFLSTAGRALHRSFDPKEVALTACSLAVGEIAASAALRFVHLGATITVAAPPGTDAGALLAESAKIGQSRYAAIPLESRKGALGSLVLERAESSRGDDPDLVAEFAQRVSSALDNACMYSNERRIAMTLQADLLPVALPQPYGMRIDAAYFPCEDETRVGGDWYDAFELHDGRLALTIGDVAGHGIAAAAMMGKLRYTIRAGLLGGASPAGSLALANDVAYFGDPELTTAFVGIIDTVAMTFEWATAGHPPPVIVDADTQLVEGQGLALGVLPHLDVPGYLQKLPERGAIALYTDGVVEYARDLSAGIERLRECLRAAAPARMTLRAHDLARDVMGENLHIDDAALLLVCFEPVREVDLVVAALPSQSETARRALLRFSRAWGLDDERSCDLVLASCEALNNAIEHAYGGRSSGKVRVRAFGEPGRLVVTVSDYGRWSDRPPRGDRGRGLALIEALADRVEIQRAEEGTSVRVTFEVTPREAVGAAAFSELPSRVL